MREIWCGIKNYEGFYQVANKGRVKSLQRNSGNHYNSKDRILTPRLNFGYCLVCLYKGKDKRQVRVHRLVAETFIPNPDNKPQVNHKDGNKEFNFKTNLEWVTASENIQHAFNIGLKSNEGEKHSQAKLSEADVLQIKDSKLKQRELAEIFRVTQPLISLIKSGKSWSHICNV